jgi:hypothetical protein
LAQENWAHRPGPLNRSAAGGRAHVPKTHYKCSRVNEQRLLILRRVNGKKRRQMARFQTTLPYR